jgi:DNA-directed RNA polymerase specialized sigma24 family protein
MPNDDPPRQPAGFATTQWSVVVAAAAGDSTLARGALGTLCRAYWYPLYAFVRRRGYGPDEAQDLTQAFFTKVLEADAIALADRGRGRFRTFLLASLKHFLADEWDRARAAKRGGGRAVVPLHDPIVDADAGETWYGREPSHDLTAERLFDRRWALLLLERVLADVRDRYAAEGKGEVFERLKQFIGGGDGAAGERHAAVAADLGMTAGAVKVAVHRLRQRYAQTLREAIAATVDSPEAVDDEIRALFAAVAG